jgi:hypothetical protein
MVSDESSTDRSSLPANRAFVVQLREGTDPAAGEVVGRVEHVTSGRSRRFADVRTLIEFFHQTLAEREEVEK